jgi:hypothetical protein
MAEKMITYNHLFRCEACDIGPCSYDFSTTDENKEFDRPEHCPHGVEMNTPFIHCEWHFIRTKVSR